MNIIEFRGQRPFPRIELTVEANTRFQISKLELVGPDGRKVVGEFDKLTKLLEAMTHWQEDGWEVLWDQDPSRL